MKDITTKILESYKKDPIQQTLPKTKVIEILDLFMGLLLPGLYFENGQADLKSLTADRVDKIVGALPLLLQKANMPDPEKQALQLLDKVPFLRKCIAGDIKATMEGDPAAASIAEIIISYPGIYAIAVYRLAHQFHLQKVPIIPRIMTEKAHSVCGIDIHPGASIGCNFFIDHGTGCVIGETTIIGDNVMIYQGVTLGALAPAKGQPLKNIKRHPTIENNVTIYAEATLLGDITIGAGSTIGGNVWLKKSIPPNTLVFPKDPELIFKSKKE